MLTIHPDLWFGFRVFFYEFFPILIHPHMKKERFAKLRLQNYS